MKEGEERVAPPPVNVSSFDTLQAVRAMQQEFQPFRDEVFDITGKQLADYWLRERATDRNLLEQIARRIYIDLIRPEAASRRERELTIEQREHDAIAIANGGRQG